MLNISLFSASCITVSLLFFACFVLFLPFVLGDFLKFMDNLYTLLLHRCRPVTGPTLLRPTPPQIKKGGSDIL